MNICVYGAASNKIDPLYIEKVEELGRLLAKRGHGLVYGGGANGLMGAVASGVSSVGGEIIGVAPSFFKPDGVLYTACTEFIYTETMRERKQAMEDRSDAFLVTPGGIGTFEEFFEILTLRKLGRHKKPIAVYNLNGYFDPARALLDRAVEEGFMDQCDESLCLFSADPEAILAYLEAHK